MLCFLCGKQVHGHGRYHREKFHGNVVKGWWSREEKRKRKLVLLSKMSPESVKEKAAVYERKRDLSVWQKLWNALNTKLSWA